LKYLLLALALVVVYWLWKAYKRKARRSSSRAAAAAAEDMVRCAQCGVHLPRSESLANGELFYCTPEHRRLHQKPD
jgi:uncharacterized protein